MEVITIESEAFQRIIKNLDEIKEQLKVQQKESFTSLWLDNNEVSAVLKVTKRTLQDYRDKGMISFSQVGSKIYYQASAIEEFLKKHYKPAFNTSR